MDRLDKFRFTGSGTLAGIVSGILYSMSSASATFLLQTKSQIFASWTRFLVIVLLNLPLTIIFQVNLKKYGWKDWLWYIVIGILGVLIQVCLYVSVEKIGLSNALTLMSCQPVFAAIFGALLLGETFGVPHFIQLLFCMTGVVLCTQPDFIFHASSNTKTSVIGDIFGLLTAVFYASVMVVTKKIKDADFLSYSLVKYTLCFVFAFVYYVIFEEFQLSISPMEWLYAVLNGLFAWFAAIFMLLGLKLDKAVMVSMGITSELVGGIVIDKILFDTNLNYLSIIGAVLILTSVIIVAIAKLCESDDSQED